MPSGATDAPPPRAATVPDPRLLTAVATVNSCEPLIASVLVAVTVPAPTLVNWRSAPALPIETTEATGIPAGVPPLIV